MKKLFTTDYLLLTGILILAGFLRFWMITQFPAGFSADEATIGYNAYSILKTGKDEYGVWFPIAFRAFSDYQAPLYTYLTIPFIVIFGLSEFAVRAPSAIFGVVNVFVVYLLLNKLFNNRIVGLFASFSLAISPWHIFFSRGAWQTNLATFLISLGIYFFVLGLKKTKFMPFAVVSLITSMYAYQSPRLIIPVFGLFSFLIFWKEILRNSRAFMVSFILGLILLIPVISILVSPAGQARFKGVSIFTDPGPINRINELRGEHQNIKSANARVFHNKLQTFATVAAKNYGEHFGPQFLFMNGDPIGRHNVPEQGVLLLFDFVLLPLGLFFALQKSNLPKTKVILLWLILAPIASILTFQTPNALRAANMAIPLAIFSGLGAFFIFDTILRSRLNMKGLILIVGTVIIIFSLIKFLHQYYVHLPKKYSLEWEYGFREMISFVSKEQKQYSKIIITNRYDQPYILTLFYLGYDPKLYQTGPKHISTIDKFGFTTIQSFDKYEFRKISKEEIKNNLNVLFIGTPEEIPEYIPADHEIYFPNGKKAFRIVRT